MPSRTPAEPRACPIDRTLQLLGDRWSLLVIREVMYGQRRFEAIFHGTGAPRDVLTVRLRRLVEAGLLRKRPYNESGTRFEYHLTAKGLSLRPVLIALGEWGETQLPDQEAPWRELMTSLS